MLDGRQEHDALGDIQDDTALIELVAQPVLAIADGEAEGEPDSESDHASDGDDDERHMGNGGSFEHFGSFTLRSFTTKRNKVARKQLLMRCPYHRDEGQVTSQ